MSTLWAAPGQGAQYPGMLHQLPDDPLIHACLAQASAALGEDVLALDSSQALQSTRAVQLCLLVAGVASARLLIQRGHCPDYVAGLSIGAYTAAVIAEALDFADAVQLVALRGELMQAAYPSGYGMTAVLGLDLGQVEQLVAQVHSPALPLYLANINADNQLVVAGSIAGMAALADLAKAAGAGAVKVLAVSVPSHCELLAAPAARLAEAFARVEVRRPRVRYLSSSSARLILDADKLRDDLAYNMCRLVNWHNTLQTAFERGVRLHLELPPGTVLSGLARRVFTAGNAVAFQGARLDTLDVLLSQASRQDR